MCSSDLKFADNAIGMTQAAGDIGSSRFHGRLIDSLVVGETENVGNPRTPEEIAYGRSHFTNQSTAACRASTVTLWPV